MEEKPAKSLGHWQRYTQLATIGQIFLIYMTYILFSYFRGQKVKRAMPIVMKIQEIKLKKRLSMSSKHFFQNLSFRSNPYN